MSATVQIRVRLLPSAAARLATFSRAQKALVISSLVEGAYASVDLHGLVATLNELRRVGTNLNQSLRLLHSRGGALTDADADAVRATVVTIDRLRGRDAP